MSTIAKDCARLLRSTLASPALRWLMLLAAALITVHILVATRQWETPDMAIEYLRIDKDRGLAEIVEYGLLMVGLGAAFSAWIQTRDGAFLFIAALVAYLQIDDVFALHELFGQLLPFGSSAIGEVVPSLVAGVAFLLWGIRRISRSDGAIRNLLIVFGLTIAYIAFFGVLVDGLHGLFIAPFSPLDGPITVLEDGNELIGMVFLAVLLGKHCPKFGTAAGDIPAITQNI